MIIPSERGLAGETRRDLNMIIPLECGLPGGFKHENPVRMSFSRRDLGAVGPTEEHDRA